jgi:hypothetical protein
MGGPIGSDGRRLYAAPSHMHMSLLSQLVPVLQLRGAVYVWSYCIAARYGVWSYLLSICIRRTIVVTMHASLLYAAPRHSDHNPQLVLRVYRQAGEQIAVADLEMKVGAMINSTALARDVIAKGAVGES